MHIYFSGIGGTGIGPLALIAHSAGFEVSGSDTQESGYIEYLKKHGISNITIGQTAKEITRINSDKQIDWFVYSSAIPKTDPNNPELLFVHENNIKHSKRDEFLNEFLKMKYLKMIAIAGTHGKTTTTAMVVWTFKQLGIPISYSVGGKLSFGDMGEYNPDSEYFVYEADEYDRNFLSFAPALSIIPGIAYDHPDIYPTQTDYNQAFLEFIEKSKMTWLWQEDAVKIDVQSSKNVGVLHKSDYEYVATALAGDVNRQNAALVAQAIFSLDESQSIEHLSEILDEFPGVARRFEKIFNHLYSDYAHTPEKIEGALQLAGEVASGLENVVIIYEGLHNTRQHFILKQLTELFQGIKKLYVVPSYLARENESLEMLTPEKLCTLMSKPDERIPSGLDETLKYAIDEHIKTGDLVLCLTAGGGGSLDEWLRKQSF